MAMRARKSVILSVKDFSSDRINHNYRRSSPFEFTQIKFYGCVICVCTHLPLNANADVKRKQDNWVLRNYINANVERY